MSVPEKRFAFTYARKLATVFGATALFISTLKLPTVGTVNCTTCPVMLGTAK